MGEALRAALSTVRNVKALTATDILGLRRAVYDDGAVDEAEARRLIELHRDGARGECDIVWADFLVETLADYFAIARENPDYGTEYKPDFGRALMNVARAAAPLPAWRENNPEFTWSGAPRAAILDHEADALMDAFRKQGGLNLDVIEMRLLARIFDRAVEVPAKLRAFAIVAISTTVSEDQTITAEEVTFLRRVFYGPGGDGGISISRPEAEALFAMRDEADARAPEWRDLFVKAVTMHVLFAGASPERLDAAEVSWLANKLGPPEDWDEEAHALIDYVVREAQELHESANELLQLGARKAA